MEKENLEQIKTDGNEKDYIEQIQALKANSVPKNEYTKLQEENAKLIKTLANNEKIELETKKSPKHVR
jgi:hypothetical protein